MEHDDRGNAEEREGGDHSADGARPSLPARLARHRTWVETAGREGERLVWPGAALAGADLRGACLVRADLAGADLRDSRLAGADLAGADLQGASVAGADFSRASLMGACLRGIRGLNRAVLRDANLEDAYGLTGAEFADADLTGVRLPATLSFDGRLDYIAEASQNARPAFLSILLSCAFVLLTVLSTTDGALLSNTPSAVLPDLSTAIPAASLFWVAPVLLFALFVYLHLQIGGIGETLAELPAIFPDGVLLERRAYPWLMTGLLRFRHGWRGLGIEEAVTGFLFWGSVPVTLAAIWWRYLPLRHAVVSGLHILLILGSIWVAMRMFERVVASLTRGALGLPRRRRILLGTAVFLVAISAFSFAGPWLLDLNPRRTTWLIADIRDADLKGASLKRKDLRFVSARKAILVEADLRDARLTRADLQRADFRKADLEKADLTRVDLDGADFRDACLRSVVLRDSDMEDVDFRAAYLGKADLRSPLLNRANFEDANMQGVDLRGASLVGANLRRAVLGCAISHKKKAEPVVTCANIDGADLRDADLSGADLRDAIGLTQAQLDPACGNAHTRLPAGLVVRTCAMPAPAGTAESVGPPDRALTLPDNPCAHEMRDDRWRP